MSRSFVNAIVWSLLFAVLAPLKAMAEQIVDDKPANESCDLVVVFAKEGCPYCASAHEFLDQVVEDHKNIRVVYKDIHASEKVAREFKQLNDQLRLHPPSVPTIITCDKAFVGFGPRIEKGILEKLGLVVEEEPKSQTEENSFVDLPLIGELDAQQLGLLGTTVVIGLIDGFNPCAMWVLLFLLSILVNTKSRKKMLTIAGIFVFVSGLVYFAFMAAWLNMYLIIGYSRALQVVIGLVAVTIGLINCKDFFAFKQGISLGISDRFKPKIYQKSREILQAKDYSVAIVSVIILAVMVNTVELVCTAGLPAIYTQILASHELTPASYYGYLAIYNLAYIFDDGLVVFIAVMSLQRLKLTEGHGRWLKLLAGVIILTLGILLLLKPDLLM